MPSISIYSWHTCSSLFASELPMLRDFDCRTKSEPRINPTISSKDVPTGKFYGRVSGPFGQDDRALTPALATPSIPAHLQTFRAIVRTAHLRQLRIYEVKVPTIVLQLCPISSDDALIHKVTQLRLVSQQPSRWVVVLRRVLHRPHRGLSIPCRAARILCLAFSCPLASLWSPRCLDTNSSIGLRISGML